MRPTLSRVAAVALAAVVAACGDDEKPSHDLPPLVWSWVPVAGAVCSDGSATGIAVNPSATPGADVLVFLMGGGACWDTLTCFTIGAATPGPFGEAQMRQQIPALQPGSLLDRTVASNPYKDFTFVFVPYCTGDVHTGDRTQRYTGAPRDWRHKGRVNLSNDLAWMEEHLEAPAKVVVSGSSAGGFGSLLAFDMARAMWPTAKGYLVDDSGPPLREIPPLTIAAWDVAWGLGEVVAPLCGPLDCMGDLSRLFPALQEKYPGDRLALLSSTQDTTIRNFFGTFTTTFPFVTPMDPNTFETGVRGLASRMEDDTPPGETHAFVVTGTSHTMLGNPAGFFAPDGTTTLFEWLGQQVNDDAAWSAAIPL
ncbi:MAG TPA: pectin acetylesterase-family hydrolase [Anaeromyxobacter sp.]|nr:pectin acetylesterase-family hydrolase [Anaeromyxobacter sp.]